MPFFFFFVCRTVFDCVERLNFEWLSIGRAFRFLPLSRDASAWENLHHTSGGVGCVCVMQAR